MQDESGTQASQLPATGDSTLAHIAIRILPNGDFSTLSQDVFSDDAPSDSSMQDVDDSSSHLVDSAVGRPSPWNDKLARGLDVSGDIGIWVEWIRQHEKSR